MKNIAPHVRAVIRESFTDSEGRKHKAVDVQWIPLADIDRDEVSPVD